MSDHKLAEALRGYIEDYKSEDGMFDTKHYVRQFQEALAAHEAEQQAPPYTAPKLRALIDRVAEQQAGEAVAQQPLSDEQVEAGRHEWLYSPAVPNSSAFVCGVRFAERAHGIGITKDTK